MLLVLLLQRCLQLLLLPIHALACLGLWDSFYKKVFPYVMAKVAPAYNQKVYSQKQELFSSLRRFAGPSGQLRLLEIGTGTGTNFQFYPAGCRLTCTDPNPNFRMFLLRNLSENQHLRLERLVVASGEDLHQVADGSMDVVVCTLVLCSVSSIRRVLEEVLRVLRQVCDPFWKYFGDGCCLSRETEEELEKTNFSELNLRHFHVPPCWIPTSPHIIGYAVK
ncbi:thiol S-methyltransferase METTL7B isoform X2 [Dryobates pubescens]|uniref:thiol S-methyltransferase METTL7B isoform X2 n=1 Tax=Dryobates pubescens TaxID=118200 RepID=UPI0023B94FA8|nr:thiol S-methyltransferase METTL7B isoform X2 [Dryobates pubescens]